MVSTHWSQQFAYIIFQLTKLRTMDLLKTPIDLLCFSNDEYVHGNFFNYPLYKGWIKEDDSAWRRDASREEVVAVVVYCGVLVLGE